MSSNNSKCVIQTDLKGNIGHFDTTSLRCANAFEKFENEYQTIENYQMLEYQVHQTSPKYSSSIEDSETEVLEMDKRNKFPLSQGYISEEIPNLHVKCCDLREESSEHKRKNLQDGLVTLSTVGRCIRNACDSLLGMNPCNTDQLLENTDYQLMDLISFDSKQQASFSEVELLDVNVEDKNEITSEKLESEKYQLKHDSSLFHSLSNNSSETSTEESNFKTSINTYGIHEKNPSENDYQRKHTEENLFQCNECQRTFSDRRNFNRHLLTHSQEKPLQCEVCQSRFKRKDTLSRHMLTHTGEKPFKWEVCQSWFRQKPHLLRHMRTHNWE
ncbi:hypothetical protein NPIL_103241 [Nephila pilipes]|uniref:C2H2-type domain-containing protein n=1 Tax=Nephila pilipes TaxID=299642 RepID=A0A8X6PWA1_NEPPI|nr:hypothetical protein NPIL_103241 [Nephila pilipes]